jgi:MoxR-like ATPase
MASKSESSAQYKKIFDPGPTTPVPDDSRVPMVYCWKAETVLAVNVALATRRALLIKGEPGVGKSSVAEAVAAALNWRFYRHTVTSRTEASDLTWRVDFVRRLADAQMSGLAKRPDATLPDDYKYLVPGTFWWAFDPASARDKTPKMQATTAMADPFEENAKRMANGAVVLVDEIDKADPAVANDLLDTIGLSRFRVDGVNNPFDVQWSFGATRENDGRESGGLLVIFTSNDERDLPDAFLRRCVVMELGWPKLNGKDSEARVEFDRFLFEIAAQNWKRISAAAPVDSASTEAIELVTKLIEAIWLQRRAHQDQGVRPPGLAEFLDAIAACRELAVLPNTEGWNVIERLVWQKS